MKKILAILSGIVLMAAAAMAQPDAILYRFSAIPHASPYTNSDGASPQGLMVSGSTLYGTTRQGGSSGDGTMFKINADGTGFAVITTFTNNFWNDGFTGLLLSDRSLYGTAERGEGSGTGVIFKIDLPPAPAIQSPAAVAKSNTQSFTVLHYFARYEEGSTPGDLVLSGSALYGTAEEGGLGNGVVFRIELTSPLP